MKTLNQPAGRPESPEQIAHAHYRAARRHVERRIGFLTHLAVYITVNTALVVANLAWMPRLPIAAAPLLGWGIGLLFHGLAVYLRAPGASWKQRMIENEIKRLTT